MKIYVHIFYSGIEAAEKERKVAVKLLTFSSKLRLFIFYSILNKIILKFMTLSSTKNLFPHSWVQCSSLHIVKIVLQINKSNLCGKEVDNATT